MNLLNDFGKDNNMTDTNRKMRTLVLLAAIAGVFYGRAWRQERRVGASAMTHTLVDTVWSMWLR